MGGGRLFVGASSWYNSLILDLISLTPWLVINHLQLSFVILDHKVLLFENVRDAFKGIGAEFECYDLPFFTHFCITLLNYDRWTVMCTNKPVYLCFHTCMLYRYTCLWVYILYILFYITTMLQFSLIIELKSAHKNEKLYKGLYDITLRASLFKILTSRSRPDLNLTLHLLKTEAKGKSINRKQLHYRPQALPGETLHIWWSL